MAGRQFNRLRKQMGEDLPPAPASESEGSEGEDDASPGAKPFNPFDLLTDEEGGEREEQSEDEEDGGSDGGGPSPGPQPAAAAAKPSAASKRRKQKKKKKGKAAAADDDDEEGDGEGGGQAADAGAGAGEEDIDAILQELNIKVPAGAPSGAGAAAARTQQAERPLLGVELRNLRADEELRRMFGSKVVEAEGEERGDAFAGASRRVRRLAARGLLQRAQLKRGAIITPRDTWPRFDGGVSMEYRGVTPEGKLEFSYAYSQAYQAVQELYEQCQASFDPNNVAALLHSHPYHLDALLTMHDLYRSMGENAYADEMLERCVYALEMAWHPSFNLAAANMLVPFDEPNKPLFLALFKYQQVLSRRGLHKTALEVCKLLLALNPDDPMGALFAIDYLAVRAGRYAFLQQLAERGGGSGAGGVDQSTALLPNIVFSLALARWYQEQEQESKRGRASSSGGSSSQQQQEAGSSSAGGGGDSPGDKSSSDLLTKAVLMYPLVVARMMRKLQEKGTGKDADWSWLLAQPLLRDADDGGSPSLSHLVDLFVERQHLLWKAQPIQEWLKAGCRRALAGEDLPDGITAADWACVREQAFPPSDENAYRHLRLYEFSDTVQRIPPEDLHGMQMPQPGRGGGAGAAAVAGMRPEELAAIEAELRELDARVQAEGRVPEEYLREGNPLAMLLRTLLPWFNAGQQPDYAAEDEEGEEEGQQRQ